MRRNSANGRSKRNEQDVKKDADKCPKCGGRMQPRIFRGGKKKMGKVFKKMAFACEKCGYA